MTIDHEIDLSTKVPEILAKGIEVLIYSGDQDFICNWMGGHAWTENLKWSGQKEFQKQELKEFEIDGVAAGAVKSHQNLQFMRVYNAGHQVPMD